jgi:class 3 adenylate cyclase
MGINEALLEKKLTELEAVRAWSPRVMARLETLVRTADEGELFRINPVQFADDRGIREDEAIDLFLHGANIGLFDFNWHLLCPACADVVDSFRKLRSVHSHYSCPLCQMNFEANLDDYVEVSFTIASAIRDIRFHHPESLTVEEYYLRYEHSPHGRLPNGMRLVDVFPSLLVGLRYIEPGSDCVLEADLVAGWLAGCDRLTNAGWTATVEGEPATAVQALELVLENGNLEPVGAAAAAVRPGPVRIVIHNRDSRRGSIFLLNKPLAVEGVLLSFAPFLTGKRVLTTQTFRDIFRAEVVEGGQGITVRDLSFMFTDLKGSTALYERIGDLKAFTLVQQHFDVLGKVVREHHGAIVKTIGDAVMACFMTPADALRAALAMIAGIEAFNQRRDSTDIVLKIGLHRGYAIAVGLNERLDYFGQTVNIAARVQGLAEANEICMTPDVYQDADVAAILADHSCQQERAQLKGVVAEMPIKRLHVRQ